MTGIIHNVKGKYNYIILYKNTPKTLKVDITIPKGKKGSSLNNLFTIILNKLEKLLSI